MIILALPCSLSVPTAFFCSTLRAWVLLCTLMAESFHWKCSVPAPVAPGRPSPYTGNALQALPLACCMPPMLRSSLGTAFPRITLCLACGTSRTVGLCCAEVDYRWACLSPLDNTHACNELSKGFLASCPLRPVWDRHTAVFSRVEWSRLRQAFQPADRPRTRLSPNQRCIASATCTSQPL